MKALRRILVQASVLALTALVLVGIAMLSGLMLLLTVSVHLLNTAKEAAVSRF